MALIPYYEQQAVRLVDQYESLAFEDVHASLLDLLPPPGATVLDIGAGSGRDAAWLAAHGYEVVAVEPSDAMLAQARRLHASNRIHWLSDSLPDLTRVRRLGLHFDLILLSAVWMHVPPATRQRALRKLATLLAPRGRIAISLRLGAPDSERAMHAVSPQELSSLALQFGLRVVRTTDSPDKLGRSEVAWTNVVLGLPDDGLGALPLLRHLILVDEKSSTYKVALLRVLARIADTAAGLARYEADAVVVPLGLVALFWMRMVKPLIEHGLPQMPASRLGTGPGFVTDSFNALQPLAPVELRIGAVFGGQTAKHLHRSLSQIAQLIRDMPAKYLRWPASDKPIFTVSRRRQLSAPERLLIDAPFLWSLGDFRVPLELWQALSHYNVWVEPVLVSEWVRLMENYAGRSRPDVRALAHTLLAWADPVRDTRLARTAVERIRAAGKPVYCVWSGARLKDDYDVDHCFPYAAWPCGDAWNLMPAARRINIQKSNRLVTQAGLARASERIVDWWADAWLGQGEEQGRQFFLEASQTLPVLASSPRTADIIDAMKLHRIRLAKDQGLRPWEPASLGERVTAD
ncbi:MULTISPECIES: methyltransferase domain-containing protein [unclassified Massilia]|uniref:methyltransferase domain-containing protein n=1 Tax=unclassified Massilia TaxID=2609279 RepID=UPI001780AE42|nr:MULTISPECIES: methyltransferase domain-containing protein [unclassified Massilia]MBD8532236.1 methyltransferase domain-containing protein [Massilia sp. CFBP 13647]MBD8675689.1 methyltransferase domain-containing protein [Massilia sp. CFBP 13721]